MRSSRFFFLLIGSILWGSVSAQIKLKTYTSQTDTFYWKKYEHFPKPARANLNKFTVRNGENALRAFLIKPPESFLGFSGDSIPGEWAKSMKKQLYPIDLNGDQLPDIVFNAAVKNGKGVVQIYLNRLDTFELVFEDWGYVSQLKRNKAGYCELTIGESTGQGDNLYFERSYTIRQEDHQLLFIRGKQTAIYKYTQRPGKYYDKPHTFTAQHDTLLVRASAGYIDAPYDPKLKTFGNTICGYTSAIGGAVLATEKDKNGIPWFFVEIYPDVHPVRSIFSDTGKYPTFIMGWVPREEIILK